MAALNGSKTEDNLKAAFAGESQANRRYLYFAQKADVEGYNDVAAVFRSTAEGETGHAHGHLEFLEEVGDPATGLPIGETEQNLERRRRRRNARIHRHVSRHGAHRPRGRLRRDRRLVRDARQGRALARRPFPEGARRVAEITGSAIRCTSRDSALAGRDFPGARKDFGHLPPILNGPAYSWAIFFLLLIFLALTFKAEAHRMSEGGLAAPTRHPLDWQNPDFYDEAKLDAEMRRVFDICHGCRRCFNLCDSFPRLFDLDRRRAERRTRHGRAARTSSRSSTPARSATCAT